MAAHYTRHLSYKLTSPFPAKKSDNDLLASSSNLPACLGPVSIETNIHLSVDLISNLDSEDKKALPYLNVMLT
jgi:hypothetical protein